MTTITYRDLTRLEDYGAVVELERQIWGPAFDGIVPVSILAVTVKRGGILVGAFAGERLIGFVYSLPGIKNGKPTQWSDMLGVIDQYRSGGVGRRLKLLQRERALAMALDLVEWTYDPMQAINAHLNFAKLGVVVEEYEENIYGESASPLHRGNPTDRFVAEWWIREPHVERRLADASRFGLLRTSEIAEAPAINRVRKAADWLECAEIDLSRDERRIAVIIPVGFTDMLTRAPELALEWRMATRQIFTTYFARGYRAVEFFLDQEKGRGSYLLAQEVKT